MNKFENVCNIDNLWSKKKKANSSIYFLLQQPRELTHHQTSSGQPS